MRATIHVNTAGYNWTMGDPAGGQIDAMRGMMHEIAHAIGWTVALDRYAANVVSVGGNRFYDLDHDGAFRADTDFDLIDVRWQGTHAPDGSRADASLRTRGCVFVRRTTRRGVTDAFDYSVMLDGLRRCAGLATWLWDARTTDLRPPGSAVSVNPSAPSTIPFFVTTTATSPSDGCIESTPQASRSPSADDRALWPTSIRAARTAGPFTSRRRFGRGRRDLGRRRLFDSTRT